MTVNLVTSYLGLPLRSPLVVGAAAPLSVDGALLPHLEDAGAAAIVLHSLFLEQVERDWQEWEHHQRRGSNSYGEALSYMPAAPPSHLGLNGYLAEIRAATRLVAIPVIASLNSFIRYVQGTLLPTKDFFIYCFFLFRFASWVTFCRNKFTRKFRMWRWFITFKRF
jgi:hypothetical protein